MKEMIGGCCVCLDDRGYDENPIVYCDGSGCSVAVHQACYGIISVPTGPWFCRKCESQERAARVRCELCPHKDGALKRTDNGGWCHVVCALYIPEVSFASIVSMEPIIIKKVPFERYNKACYLCEEQGRGNKATSGACMQCNYKGFSCKQHFHVTCAQAMGLLKEESNSKKKVSYCGYCGYHIKKLRREVALLGKDGLVMRKGDKKTLSDQESVGSNKNEVSFTNSKEENLSCDETSSGNCINNSKRIINDNKQTSSSNNKFKKDKTIDTLITDNRNIISFKVSTVLTSVENVATSTISDCNTNKELKVNVNDIFNGNRESKDITPKLDEGIKRGIEKNCINADKQLKEESNGSDKRTPRKSTKANKMEQDAEMKTKQTPEKVTLTPEKNGIEDASDFRLFSGMEVSAVVDVVTSRTPKKKDNDGNKISKIFENNNLDAVHGIKSEGGGLYQNYNKMVDQNSNSDGTSDLNSTSAYDEIQSKETHNKRKRKNEKRFQKKNKNAKVNNTQNKIKTKNQSLSASKNVNDFDQAFFCSDAIQQIPSFSSNPPIPKHLKPALSNENFDWKNKKVSSIEELLEIQWNLGASLLHKHGQGLEISPLLEMLTQLQNDNRFLENSIEKLASQRDHLLFVNNQMANNQPHHKYAFSLSNYLHSNSQTYSIPSSNPKIPVVASNLLESKLSDQSGHKYNDIRGNLLAAPGNTVNNVLQQSKQQVLQSQKCLQSSSKALVHSNPQLMSTSQPVFPVPLECHLDGFSPKVLQAMQPGRKRKTYDKTSDHQQICNSSTSDSAIKYNSSSNSLQSPQASNATSSKSTTSYLPNNLYNTANEKDSLCNGLTHTTLVNHKNPKKNKLKSYINSITLSEAINNGALLNGSSFVNNNYAISKNASFFNGVTRPLTPNVSIGSLINNDFNHDKAANHKTLKAVSKNNKCDSSHVTSKQNNTLKSQGSDHAIKPPSTSSSITSNNTPSPSNSTLTTSTPSPPSFPHFNKQPLPFPFNPNLLPKQQMALMQLYKQQNLMRPPHLPFFIHPQILPFILAENASQGKHGNDIYTSSSTSSSFSSSSISTFSPSSDKKVAVVSSSISQI